MYKFKSILLLLLVLTNTAFFSQNFTQEQKEIIISRLDSSDAIGTIWAIMDYKIYEAIPKIKERIWLQKNRNTQVRFIKALQVLGSEDAHQYALDFLDTLHNNPNPFKNTVFDTINAKFDITEILINLGDYSTVNYVFDYIEYQNKMIDPTAVILLAKIMENVPEYRTRAKEELMRIAETEKELYSNERYYAVEKLYEYYGDEMLPYVIERYWAEKDANNRSIMLNHLLVNKASLDVLKDILVNEPSGTIKYSAMRIILSRFPSPENYMFIKNYVYSYSGDPLYESLMPYDVKTYDLEPDTKTPPLTMLDTLTSYTNQCYGYEWLKDETYKNELLNKLTNAKDNLTAGDSLGCRREVEAFQNSVNQVYQDSAGSYPKYVSEEGYKFLYYYAGYILDRLPEETFPPNDIDAKVKAKVIKKKDGKLKYKYKLKNKSGSGQNINRFYLKERSDTLSLNAPEGWNSGEIATSNMLYFRADSTGAEIKPGENLKWFTVKAKELPYIANYYIQSFRESIDTNDVYGNSATGVTLSPALAPSPFYASEFIDTLKSYTTKAYDLGWIKKEQIYNRLINKLNKAKSQLEAGRERKAKTILRNYVKLTRRKWCKRKITSEGLALLKFNAQYLIRHIGPPDTEESLAAVSLKGVERTSGETRKYKYKLHNNVNNTKKLKAFYVEEETGNFSVITPGDWTSETIDSLNLTGFVTTVSSAMVKPDKKKGGYEYHSESLPVVMPYYILTEDQPTETDTILYGSITGFTLGAESLPEEFDGLEQTDNLYEYVEEANDLGWIKKENVYDKLLDKVNTIRKKIENGKTNAAKDKLQDFVDYVQDKYDEDKITKEARILLRQNANYIKRNL